MMIIDPVCYGARLREDGENRNSPTSSQLLTDVDHTTKEMMQLLQIVSVPDSSQEAILDCRYYQLPPQSFVCWTNNVCYVQPYHFWDTRDPKTSIPMFKYRPLPHSGEHPCPMHHGMKKHFDWIWEHASISLSDYKNDFICGTDGGIHQTGAINCFTDGAVACTRMLSLLRSNPREVDIIGVSLHSFFELGTALNFALDDLLKLSDIQIRLLLLNPDCDQAKYRSYREHLLDHGNNVARDEYLANPDHHKHSTLYRHTSQAITFFKGRINAIASDSATANLKVEMRRYDLAPSCFMMRVDDTVLVEQYGYGKVQQNVRVKNEILGKDMPLFEYKKDTSQRFYPDLRSRTPFNLLVDHFKYIWESSILVASYPSKGSSDDPKAARPS